MSDHAIALIAINIAALALGMSLGSFLSMFLNRK